MMISTELLISDLYQTCAEIWEQDGAFWSALVEEEKKHAMNMKKMAKIIADKPERFDMGRPFNQIAIKTIMNGINDNRKRLKEGLIDRSRMMFLARDIEDSLIEKNYSEIVRTNDLEYHNLMSEIEEETRKHKSMMTKRIQALKTKGFSTDKVNRISWNPQYSVHVEAIDTQHKELFTITNSLMDQYEQGSGDCYATIEKLVDYLSKHFYDEELVMMKVNYYGYKKHVEEHRSFADKVGQFLQAYRNKEENITLEMVSFLREWIFSHTTGSDLKYGRLVLKANR